MGWVFGAERRSTTHPYTKKPRTFTPGAFQLRIGDVAYTTP